MKKQLTLALLPLALFFSGCASPYYADQGALLGGLTGAGLGAIVGNQLGSTVGGAAIGAAAGTITGAAVGTGLDDIEARNQAMIAQQLGRPAPTGAIGTAEVIQLSQAGVSEQLIVNHIRTHGAISPPTTDELILLQNSGVSPNVIAQMQRSRPPVAQAVHTQPVIVEEHYYAPPRPYYGYHYHHGRCYPRRHRPHAHFSVSVRN